MVFHWTIALYPRHLSEVVMGQRLVEARRRGPVVVGPILVPVVRGFVLGLGPRLPQVEHVLRPVEGLKTHYLFRTTF